MIFLIDFEINTFFVKSTAFTRNVSKIQFGRVLSTLNLMPATEMFTLLCKKFEDSVNGDINYPLFCQVVDDGKNLINDSYLNKISHNNSYISRIRIIDHR